jgi:DNA-directed RNA polymerase subunit RPC12/RpoP
MAYGIEVKRKWWQKVGVCCPRCGSADLRYLEIGRLYICDHCGRQCEDGLLHTSENRPLIRQLRATWGDSGG